MIQAMALRYRYEQGRLGRIRTSIHYKIRLLTWRFKQRRLGWNRQTLNSVLALECFLSELSDVKLVILDKCSLSISKET